MPGTRAVAAKPAQWAMGLYRCRFCGFTPLTLFPVSAIEPGTCHCGEKMEFSWAYGVECPGDGSMPDDIAWDDSTGTMH